MVSKLGWKPGNLDLNPSLVHTIFPKSTTTHFVATLSQTILNNGGLHSMCPQQAKKRCCLQTFMLAPINMAVDVFGGAGGGGWLGDGVGVGEGMNGAFTH